MSGRLLRTFENHHTRGIASIDLKGGDVLSGSSDRHLRLINLQSNTGWATAPPTSGNAVCQTCGQPQPQPTAVDCTHTHTDLVRSVSFGEGEAEFVVSASYDLTIKVWDRHTGQMVANLSGGHEGRIFCVGFDCTKVRGSCSCFVCQATDGCADCVVWRGPTDMRVGFCARDGYVVFAIVSQVHLEGPVLQVIGSDVLCGPMGMMYASGMLLLESRCNVLPSL